MNLDYFKIYKMKLIKKIIFILFNLLICVNAIGQNSYDNDIFSDSIAFAEYIYINTHYPLIDFVNNIEGMTIYAIDIDSIGRITNNQLIHSSGSKTLDLEARRLIYETPIQKRGKNSTRQISINFKLADNKIYNENEIEEKPEEIEMFNFIFKHFNYPESTRNLRQGRILCGFVIEKDGTIGAIEILLPLDNLIDAEVLRAIKKMPKLEPGKKNGIPVRVYFTLPLNFSLR